MGIVRQPLFSVEYSLKLLEAGVPVSLDGPARGMDNVRHLPMVLPFNAKTGANTPRPSKEKSLIHSQLFTFTPYH